MLWWLLAWGKKHFIICELLYFHRIDGCAARALKANGIASLKLYPSLSFVLLIYGSINCCSVFILPTCIIATLHRMASNLAVNYHRSLSTCVTLNGKRLISAICSNGIHTFLAIPTDSRWVICTDFAVNSFVEIFFSTFCQQYAFANNQDWINIRPNHAHAMFVRAFCFLWFGKGRAKEMRITTNA